MGLLKNNFNLVRVLLGAIGLGSAALTAQTVSEGPENFRIEITGADWLVDSGGRIQANGSPIDLVNDLGVKQQQQTFYGQFVFKPGRKHRIVLEGTPFRLEGYNTVDRSISYRGQTFSVTDTLQSWSDLNYMFAGYQYDVLSGSRGHLGFSGGGAYLSATGTIRSLGTGQVASKSETVGLPLAGFEFRIFPVRGRRILEIDGGMRGMDYGDYGHYVEAAANGGVGVGPVTLQAGYRAVNLDLHIGSAGGSGVAARLKGPIFSLLWRW